MFDTEQLMYRMEQDSMTETVKLTTKCVMCSGQYSVTIPEKGWINYNKLNGPLIQEAFPDLDRGSVI